MLDNLGQIVTLTDFVNLDDWVKDWIEDVAADNGIPLAQALEIISPSKLEAAMVDAGFDFIADALNKAENTIGRLGPPDA